MVEEHIFKLRKIIDELASLRGRHTELVSVYIPAEYNLQEIINMLRQEYTLTENVKNKTVRNNVLAAIDKILQELRYFNKTPPNGLALFAGNVAENEGQTDIKVWNIQPPEPMRVKKYWCDQKFELEPLQDMVAEKELYGLIALDNREATIGLLKGKKIVLLRKIDSIVPGKTIKGGQSAQRYERIREGLINDWYKVIAENVKDYLSSGKYDLKGIILGGPGPAKNDFFDGDYMPIAFKKQFLGTRNIGYTDEQGLEELVERSQDLLQKRQSQRKRSCSRSASTSSGRIRALRSTARKT